MDNEEEDDSDGEGDEVDKDARESLFAGQQTACPGRADKMIDKGIISFHFIGDLNDRYWTCHVFVYAPRLTATGMNEQRWFADDRSFRLAKPSGEGNKNTLHGQRKILEARFFARATKAIVDDAKSIMDYIADEIGEEASIPGPCRDTFSVNIPCRTIASTTQRATTALVRPLTRTKPRTSNTEI